MKKVFTSLCLAAMALLVITPAFAQKQQLTNQEKTAILQKAVPAMLDQVKNISGINLVPEEGEITIEDALASPLFNTIVPINAELNAITFQPDSVWIETDKLGIEGIPPSIAPLLRLFITFSDYKTFKTSVGDQPIEISIPQKIVGSIPMMNFQNAITLTIAIGDQKALLPFSSLDVDLLLSPEIEPILGGEMLPIKIKSGKLITFTETATSAATFDYKLVLEEGLRSMMIPENEAKTPNFLVKLSMADAQTKGLIEASLYGILGATTQVNMGDATVQMNAAQQVEVINLTSYAEGTVSGYRKMTYTTEQKSTTQSIITMADSIRLTKDADWEWQSKQITTFTNYPVTKSASIAAVLNQVISATSVEPLNANITIENVVGSSSADPIKTMETDIKSAVGGTTQEPALVTTIKVSTLDEETLEFGEDMRIVVNIPLLNSEVVKIDFKPIVDGNEVLMATMYTVSNLMGGGTSNEGIAGSDWDIVTYEGGVQVLNCEKATYSIVNLQGVLVGKGCINSASEYISTPNLGRGNIYIFVINENGTQKSFKYISK